MRRYTLNKVDPKWKSLLRRIIKDNTAIDACNNQKLQKKSSRIRREKTLYDGFKLLRSHRILIKDPYKFKNKHLVALVAIWQSKNYAKSTITVNISDFRTLCRWIDKPHMVLPTSEYIKIAMKKTSNKSKTLNVSKQGNKNEN